MNFESLVSHIDTVQHALQAQAAHAVNLSLTARNWLIGYYIVKKLELRLNTKGLTERRFREFRRLYQVYPQLQSPVAQYIVSHSEIRHTLSAEFVEPIRHTPTAELQNVDIQTENWQMPASKLFNKLPYSHLKFISKIENPVKRSFYEMESMRGCWSARELERQIHSLYYERVADCHRTKKRCRHWCSSKQPSYSQKML